MSIASERAWLMICIQLAELANDAGATNIYSAGKPRRFN